MYSLMLSSTRVNLLFIAVLSLLCLVFVHLGAKCSSLVRAFTHGAMGRRVDPSSWTYWIISRSSHISTTGVTKAVVRAILSVG